MNMSFAMAEYTNRIIQIQAHQEAIKANEILSLSDKTIDSFAQVLSEKITDETLIAQTVQDYRSFLKEI